MSIKKCLNQSLLSQSWYSFTHVFLSRFKRKCLLQICDLNVRFSQYHIAGHIEHLCRLYVNPWDTVVLVIYASSQGCLTQEIETLCMPCYRDTMQNEN